MLLMDGDLGTMAGRYELVAVIGRGGMGTVYRARDLILGRTVAVKVLPAAFADQDATHVARFEREARAAASLSHPGVVAVFDAGAAEGTRFIVMEYVAGRSLEAVLRDDAPLEPNRAMNIAEQVADALAAAHAAGIVHRDVKPGNVMIADDGSVKVLDFGIARALDGTSLTHSASVLGTAGYMAPERTLGRRADERSDIYSLGCVLYAMLAARPPFVGEAVAAVLHQHVNVDPRPLRDLNPSVSPALDALVMDLLAKSPNVRPGSAAQVRDRLRELLTGSSAVPPREPTSPTARLAETAATRVLPRRPRANRRLVAAALAGGGLGIVLIALTSGGGGQHPAAVQRNSTASKTTSPSAHSSTNTTPSSATTTADTRAASTNTPPASVASAAGALTSLVTQDVASGTIDQQAAHEVTNRLTDILNSYQMGHTADVQHKLADLSQKATMLESDGHISSAAAPPLNAAISTLSSALIRSTPTTPAQNAPPAGQPGEPPDHGGKPPGKTKKHG
jgi:serine/threonine-protein kinase